MEISEILPFVTKYATRAGRLEGMFMALKMWFFPHTLETIKELVASDQIAFEAMCVLEKILLYAVEEENENPYRKQMDSFCQ